MTGGQDEERILVRDTPEGDAETPSSAKLKFDSFSMERGPGLRFDRSLDRRTGEVELPSRRKMQEYRNARKQADNAAKSTPGAAGTAVGNSARLAAFGGHTALSHDEDDSAAADAVHEGEYAAMYASDSGYSSKRKTHSSYSEPTLKEKADAVDSASKKIQKREIQKGYHSTGNKSGSSAAAAGKKAAKERKAAKKAEEGTKDTAKAIGKFIKEHPMAALAMAGILFLIIISASMCSTCTSFFAAGGGVVSATSISADEKEIRAAEAEYSRMEQELKDSFEKEKQGYLKSKSKDNRISEVEIVYEPDFGHDPLELASLLTVLHGEYKANSVKKTLEKLLKLQYKKDVLYEVIVKESATDEPSSEPETAESKPTVTEPEAEDIKITITVTNRGISGVLEEMGLNKEAQEQFATLVLTRGNRPELFGE